MSYGMRTAYDSLGHFGDHVPTGQGVHTWAQKVTHFPDWERAGAAEARNKPRITTMSAFRQMVSDSNRYTSLTNRISDSQKYAQAAMGISGSLQDQAQQLFNLYRNGLPSENVDPAPYAAGFVKAMSESKIDFASTSRSGGSPGQTSARQQTDRENVRFDNQDYGQPNALKKWWNNNKKWAFPVLMGVSALATIGFFVNKSKSQPQQALPASRRRRSR